MGTHPDTYDYSIAGAGSAGCAVAAGLIAREAGSIAIIETGPSDRDPVGKILMSLTWLMGSRRNWRFKSAPMGGVNDRQITPPRGRMLDGSRSINSIVWFRGRRDDYDKWNVPGWGWADVETAFEGGGAQTNPNRLAHPYALTEALHNLLGSNGNALPTPESESTGLCHFNPRANRRWSAAAAFLQPASGPDLTVKTGREVSRLSLAKGRANGVFLGADLIKATKGEILSAGSIGSPDVLMRSGIGPKDSCTDRLIDAHETGQNLHDHPADTLRTGTDKSAPVTPPPQVRGVDAPWAADASIMPAVTSANTNTPSMMVGHQAASFIAA